MEDMKKRSFVMLCMTMGIVATGVTGCVEEKKEDPEPRVEETLGTQIEVEEEPKVEEPQVAAPSPCAKAPDGKYCGDEIGGQPNTQVVCSGGESLGVSQCPTGCKRQWGLSFCGDFTPCAKAPDGDYCGDTIAWPEPKHRVRCFEGKVQEFEACKTACTGAPGTAKCVNESPCAKAPDGDYCADEIGWPDPNARINCREGVAVTVFACQTGCVREMGYAYCQ
jgi:hypothetical protein